MANVEGADGTLYGTIYDGGDYGLGVVFKLALPRALDGTLNVTEDTSADGTLLATDPAGAPLTFSLVSNGTKGAVTLNDTSTGAFTYAPDGNATGTDTFTFKASNRTVDTTTATVTVTIAAVNDAPVASNGTLLVNAGSSSNGTLVATDVDSATLTFAIGTAPSKGTAQITNSTTGAYTYAANANATGVDTFSFVANDGSVDSNAASVTVTIAGNPPPVANGASFATPEDKSVSGKLSATDPNGDRLTFMLVADGTRGTATGSSNGRFTYVPQPNVNGSDSFTFQASDGTTISSAATVQITITAVNDAPIASGSSITTTVNTSVSNALQAVDADGDAISFAVAKGPRRGTVTVGSAGAFTYTPPPGFTGTDTFTFRATDTAGASGTATVTIQVTPQ